MPRSILLVFLALALPAFAPATARAALAPDTAGPVSVTILHSFQDGSVPNDGSTPKDNLIQGTDGNFYGTTFIGGSTANFQNAGHGTVFKMTPAGTVTILHNFGDGSVPNDGINPFAALVQGTDGNFYGTTGGGGSTVAADPSGSGYGTVFKMTPAGTVTILHNFGDGSVTNDGTGPAGLVQGTDGNFYGTTFMGGSTSYGTAFKMTPAGTVTILHSFDYQADPSGLAQGTDGNFYGITYADGTGGKGTIFKMTPAGTVTILHNFGDGSVPNDGAYPSAALVQGTDGNFYGTTGGGGSTVAADPSGSGYGTVFRITLGGTVTILHNFGDGSVTNDGTGPSGLLQGIDGNFYGATVDGGSTVATDPQGFGYGTAYEITSGGAVTILHNFNDGSVPNDGINPFAALVQGTDGNFYGTTVVGGYAGNGTVFRLSLTPTITSISPTSGNAGTVVTITGTNLLGTTNVLFQNASAMIYTVYSTTRIAATVPSGATTGAITVTTPGGSATSSQTFTATGSLPTITSFTPTSGPVGTSVTITGTNFTGATSVKFNGASATTFTVVSATSITATVPTGATTGTVTVTTPGGTATGSTSFTVTTTSGKPTITSIAPTTGPIGTVVTITGTNFVSVTKIRFHNAYATTYTVNSATQITVTVPTGAGTGTITVTTSAGAVTSSQTFTVVPKPTVTSITPTSGPVGTTVIITGTNFDAVTRVRFHNASATYTVNSPTQITCTVPSGAGTGTITVNESNIAAQSPQTFTVVPAPTVTSISPTSGPVGTTVIITGTNFDAVTRVRFHNASATYTVNSPTQITCTVPSGAGTGTITVNESNIAAQSPQTFTVLP